MRNGSCYEEVVMMLLEFSVMENFSDSNVILPYKTHYILLYGITAGHYHILSM